MKLIKMNCNNCGAQLDIDLDNLNAYCPYCGKKLLISIDQLGSVLAERERTKRTLGKEEYKIKREQILCDHISREEDKAWKRRVIGVIAGITGIVVLFLVVYILRWFNSYSEEKKHNEQVDYLEQLETEIDEAILQEEYDTALLKANKLYGNDKLSKKETATWDAKRETYLSLIDEKKREKDINNPENIFMPASSKKYMGKKYTYVVEQFESLGFTNITTQIALDKPGIFDKNNTVEHILIGGETKFTARDYFNKDVAITVYYYSK